MPPSLTPNGQTSSEKFQASLDQQLLHHTGATLQAGGTDMDTGHTHTLAYTHTLATIPQAGDTGTGHQPTAHTCQGIHTTAHIGIQPTDHTIAATFHTHPIPTFHHHTATLLQDTLIPPMSQSAHITLMCQGHTPPMSHIPPTRPGSSHHINMSPKRLST